MVYSVCIKDSDVYKYQEIKILGIYSSLDKSIMQVMKHHKNTISLQNEIKAEYEYYVFNCELDEEIVFNEKDAVFSYNT